MLYIWLATMAVQVAAARCRCLPSLPIPLEPLSSFSSHFPAIFTQVLFGYGVKFYSNDLLTLGGQGPSNWFNTISTDWVRLGFGVWGLGFGCEVLVIVVRV